MHFQKPSPFYKASRARNGVTRRAALQLLGSSAVIACFAPRTLSSAAPAAPVIRFGACDWSLGKMADPAAFDVAKQIGLDGVQVSLGSSAKNMSLCRADTQKSFLTKAEATGVRIASLAIGELNNTPYKSDPGTEGWVRDSIGACTALGVRVVLLAFFSKNDLRDDAPGKAEVIRRLKAVAPEAEKQNVILGIESWLSAGEHIEILDAVGSKAVQVYYDVCNSTDRGYEITKEIRKLGASRICEVHAKENGSLLGKGNVNYAAVRDALRDIGYKGWIQIEGAVPKGAGIVDSYKANLDFLRKTFAA